LIADAAYFTTANDRYGHFVGDAILKEVARAIRENTRQIDLSARYGGDEFVIVLDETDKKEAGLIAERIRASIANHNFKAYDEDLKVSVSIGIAVFPENGKEADVLINHSDQALYKAKASGRNKVQLYS
jgi:diguanylate cyclase (GGDEF)-like protein